MRRPGSMRLAGRLVAGTLLAGTAALLPVAAFADAEPTPGPNPLKLQVERLEHAKQANVKGNSASAMLFRPKDQASLAAAERAAAGLRAGQVAQLFVTKPGTYLPAESTTGLFAISSYRAATTLTSGDRALGAAQGGGPLGSDGWWLGAGAFLLLMGGVVASMRMHGGRVAEGGE